LLRTAEMRGCRRRAGSFAAFLVRTVRLSSWRPPRRSRIDRACDSRSRGGRYRSVGDPCVAGRTSPDDLSIQNGGVDRIERHEQHTLHPALPGCSLSQRAGMKKGNGRSGCYYPKSRSPSISSLREGLSPFRMDAQYVAHAAHAVEPPDPPFLDACPTIRATGRAEAPLPAKHARPSAFRPHPRA
jgi:hypothetical protein